MTQKKRIDPELVAPLENFLSLMGGGLNLHDIPAVRSEMARLIKAMKATAPEIEGIITEDRQVPGNDNSSGVAVRIYRPSNCPAPLPAVLWLHGGGYVLGSIEKDDLLAKILAKAISCVVVSVEYGLAPENTFPAPLEDCYAALKWLSINSLDLGIKKSRIAIAGGSAGGGLAASLALLARDRAEVAVAFQLLLSPMIDDRNIAPPSESAPDTFLWTRENNRIAWRSYLGHEPGGKGLSSYAAAARATDLRGLPPAYITVGELDLFLNDNITYAQRLLAAGVPTELHVFPGAYHGFEVCAPFATVTQRFYAERDTVLKRVLHRSHVTQS